MADQTDFKHITVNPAESDDVVIHAGAPAPAAAQEGPRESAPARIPEADHAGDAGPGADPSRDQADEPAEKPSFGKPTNATTSKDPAYHQTTLEDIQSFKMSKTQIAVIVVALAAIAAFVVWYLVFS